MPPPVQRRQNGGGRGTSAASLERPFSVNRRFGDGFRTPVSPIGPGGIAEIPIVFVVEPDHDARTSVSFPREPKVATLTRLGLFGDPVLPTGDARMKSLHRNDLRVCPETISLEIQCETSV